MPPPMLSLGGADSDDDQPGPLPAELPPNLGSASDAQKMQESFALSQSGTFKVRLP